jgi:hypothetical protein
MLCYPLETLTDRNLDLPQSRASGLRDSTASSCQTIMLKPRQPGTRIIKNPNVFNTNISISFDFQDTYVESIFSPPAITSTYSNQHLLVYYRHKVQWDSLDTAKYIKWDSFPWPLLKQPTDVGDITADSVEEYLRSLYQLPQNTFDSSMKEYVKDHMKRWDYNRMDARVFSHVNIGVRKKVEEGVIRVEAILQAILRRL